MLTRGVARSILVIFRLTVTRPMGPACQTRRVHHDHDDLHPAPAAGVPGRCSALRPSPEVVVIVLTGGASTRMGRHKPALEVGGRPIIERVVEAARPRRILVVGSDVGVPVGVTTVADVVPGGGPVSGLATGLAHLDHVTDAVGQRDHGDTGDQHGQQADPGPRWSSCWRATCPSSPRPLSTR